MRILVLSLLVLAGCPATGQYRSADPVPPGTWRVGGAASAGTMHDDAQETKIPTGALELSVRRGLLRELDVGARLSTAGLDLGLTWRFHEGSWSGALAPTFGGLRSTDSGLSPRAVHLFGQLAIIASHPVFTRSTYSIGPLLGAGLYWPETGGHATGLWLGGFTNLSVHFTRWSVTPELGVLRVVSGDVPVHGAALQVGVAVTRDL